MLLFLYLLTAVFGVQGLYYDSYKGSRISDEVYIEHVKANTSLSCVNDIQECDHNEGRRVDGSCNNLKNPTRGASHTPFIRLLEPVFFYNNDTKEFDSKKSKSGNEMPLPRHLRTQLTASGSVPSQMFTQLPTYFLLLLAADIVSLHDTVNYISLKPYCCEEKGKTDRYCVPNKIPNDDPVHRFSDIRCLNLTRPETFQSIACTSNTTAPDRSVSSTPLFDLSGVYGNLLSSLEEKGRKYEGGLLKYEVENGKIWPPSTKTAANRCIQNQAPRETRCHETPEDSFNGLAAVHLSTLWFWRQHNHIASELAAVNPSWNDEKVFTVARDINIAIAQQILYYELLPLMMGRENLERDGVILNTNGFRDICDEDMTPQITLEYPYVLRWVHTMQAGALDMYDKDGFYLNTYPVVNLTLRTGSFAIDDNIDHMTQGSFRQGCANIDYIVDPDIVNVGMGPLQKALDILTNDLTKNRLFGFPPYVKYRELCFGDSIRSFNDLKTAIDPERVEILRNVYESHEDIDLLAGIWVEKPIQGGVVPSTFYCVVVKQLIRNMVGDRHWYERPNRPNAFTFDQLQEVRKASIARMLCDFGDSVTKIQPHAFLQAGPDNEMCDCSEIEKIDFSAWSDETGTE